MAYRPVQAQDPCCMPPMLAADYTDAQLKNGDGSASSVEQVVMRMLALDNIKQFNEWCECLTHSTFRGMAIVFK